MHPALVRKVLYPAYRALKHDDVLTYLDEMRRVQVLAPEDIRAYQWAKLRRILHHAASHVPHYRAIFRDLGMTPEDIRSESDLARLPLLRKKDMIDDPRSFIADGYPERNLTPDATSGSTGESFTTVSSGSPA